MKFLRTDSIEGAVHALAAEHRRVLVRAETRLHKKIRIRTKLLNELSVLHARWGANDVAVRKWVRDGGVLLDFVTPRCADDRPPHDAQVIVEAPISLAALRLAAISTKHVCVVYRPPSWDMHRETVLERFPSVAEAKALWDATVESPLVNVGQYCTTHDLRTDRYRRIRRTIFRHNECRTELLIALREEPVDGVAQAVWDVIRAAGDDNDRLRVVDESMFAGISLWRPALRLMDKRGNVSIVVTRDHFLPGSGRIDLRVIARRRKHALAELEIMSEWVDALPILALPKPAPAVQIQSPVHAPT